MRSWISAMGGKIRSFSHLKWAMAQRNILNHYIYFFPFISVGIVPGAPTQAIATSRLKGGWAWSHSGSIVPTASHSVTPPPLSSRQSPLEREPLFLTLWQLFPWVADAIFFPVIPLDKTGHFTSESGSEDILRSITQSHMKISVNSETDMLLMFSIEVTTLVYNII